MNPVVPLISIITVSFNSVNSIEDTIKSIFNQTFNNYEYIIIDGGSTDGTHQIINKYSDRLGYSISEPDQGIYDAMNKGLAKVNGKYVYFIGADDLLWDKNVLENVAYHLTDESCIYYGEVVFKTRDIKYDGKFSALKLVTRNISHQSIFYPAKVFKEFIFDTRYKVFADYELNLKLFNHSKFKFKYIPITIALFNDTGVSGLNTLDLDFERDRLEIIKKNFPLEVYFYRLVRTKLASIFKGHE
jgi:glycosyltransferase involved in cell wall biosynthesis